MKNIVSLRGNQAVIEHNGNKVTSITGDEALTVILEPLFAEPVITLSGEYEKTKEGYTSNTKAITLNPGDKDYVYAVLFEKLRRGWHMYIGEFPGERKEEEKK